MKTICQLLISICLVLALASTTGCSSGRLAAQFAAFEKLGVSEAEVTGKFSSTTYKVTRESGVRKATFNHSNAWLPKVYFVRETPVMLRPVEEAPPAEKSPEPAPAPAESK
jgi:hypothetical protein